MGIRAGAAEPLLLPEFSGGHGGDGASVSGAVFNLSTSIIGAGIMSIPAAMRVLGVVPALVLIAAVAVLSHVSVEFMLRYTGWARGPPSYAGTMGDAFGRAGAAALNVFVAFTTAGTLVVYLIIIGDVMSGSAGAGDEHAGVLGELFGARWWTGREFVILATAVVVLLPLMLLRRVGEYSRLQLNVLYCASTNAKLLFLDDLVAFVVRKYSYYCSG
ncbi:unnamed protein product [Alopecurus aequalis]